MSLIEGKPCPTCYRKITKAVMKEKKQRKAERARSSMKKARENGTPLGRPKKRDDAAIKRLRKQGHSLRSIANLTGVSFSVVQRSIMANKDDILDRVAEISENSK